MLCHEPAIPDAFFFYEKVANDRSDRFEQRSIRAKSFSDSFAISRFRGYEHEESFLIGVSGDGHVWTAVMVSAVVCCSPAYILGTKCWLCLRLEPARSDLEDQREDSLDPQDVNRLLFFHVVACLLSGFLVAILNATYLILLSGFQQKSRDGLTEAIERYGSDIAAKARMDAVQTELQCCGDNSYEDWFRVPWLKLSVEGPEEAENGPRLEEQWV